MITKRAGTVIQQSGVVHVHNPHVKSLLKKWKYDIAQKTLSFVSPLSGLPTLSTMASIPTEPVVCPTHSVLQTQHPKDALDCNRVSGLNSENKVGILIPLHRDGTIVIACRILGYVRGHVGCCCTLCLYCGRLHFHRKRAILGTNLLTQV